jgi:hypothetical protein
MSDKIIWGCVNADGSIHSGTGFTVDSETDGVYTITYRESFDEPPAVVLTQNYRNWDQFGYGGGDTRDNSILIAADTFKFKAKMGGSDGKGEERNFTFIAVGPADSSDERA